MARIGLGIGVQYSRVLASIDPQAQAHYDRVIADDGIMPAGLLGCNAWVVAVKAVYGVTDITTAISAGYDPHHLGTNNPALKGIGTTAGQACSKLYSCSGASGDLVQETAASMPLLLVKNSTDANYWFGSGIGGNYCETASQTSLTFGADFSVLFYCDVLTSTSMELGGTNLGGGNLISFSIGSDRKMRAEYLGNIYASTTTYTLGNKYFRYTMSGDNLQFYTSLDGLSWTQLGSNISVVVHSSIPSNRIRVGQAVGNYANPTNGKIYSAKFYNDAILTDLIFDFNPASYNAATSQTQWTSTTGEVWTINTGTATTGYKGVLVDRTILQGDGVDDYMFTDSFAINQPNTSYSVFANYTNSASYSVGDGLSGDTRNFYCTAVEPNKRNLYVNGTGSGSVYATGFTLNKLDMVIFGINSFSSYAKCNDGTRVTASIGNANCNGQRLFVGGNTYANTKLTTHLISNTLDNSTQNTAMYNAIKSFNNNAF